LPGIGQATAISFAREGCKKIAIADQNERGLEETAKSMREVAGNNIVILQKRTNVLADNEVLDLLDAVVEQLGRVDYCANCAGILTVPNHITDLFR
jgi:NAD(P)-dependent dehydrogenase (short-subunit alcohol dehydrogenase family)